MDASWCNLDGKEIRNLGAWFCTGDILARIVDAYLDSPHAAVRRLLAVIRTSDDVGEDGEGEVSHAMCRAEEMNRDGQLGMEEETIAAINAGDGGKGWAVLEGDFANA